MNDSVTTATVVSLVLAAAAYVWMGLALSAVFRKAGEQPWKAWVPFVNGFALLELGGFSGWFILLALVPVLGPLALFVISIVAYQRINVAFGYGAGMTVLAVLLTIVWFSVLAWGPARWLGGPNRGSMRTANADLDARLGGADAASPALSFTPATAGPAFSPAPAVTPPPASTPAVASAAAAAPAVPAAPVDSAPVSAFAPSSRAESPVSAPPTADATGTEPPTEQPSTPFAPPAPAFAPRPAPAPAAAADTPAGDATVIDHPVAELDEDSDDAQIVGTTSSVAPGPRRAPISSVPTSPIATIATSPWEAPDPTHDATVLRPQPSVPWAQPADPADLTDTSAEISAVAGAPVLGAPMSARSSVSAQRKAPEVPDDGFPDETIVAPRRRPRWVLTPPLGAPIHLTSDVVIVGRRPADDPRYPNAQLVPIADETRTMSKTHARLERHDDVWTITDLASTNGVAVVAADGEEIELTETTSAPIVERFLLGDAELRIARIETL